jgi:membrane-associated protein
MTYSRFALYNITGAIIWVGVCTLGGYAFGNVPVVKDHFSLVAIGIVLVSVIPIAVEYLGHRRKAKT